jgi:hypothetical protein
MVESATCDRGYYMPFREILFSESGSTSFTVLYRIFSEVCSLYRWMIYQESTKKNKQKISNKTIMGCMLEGLLLYGYNLPVFIQFPANCLKEVL